MPHLTARVPEAQLAGREPALITALTDAVVEVYGPWARDVVVIHLDGVPRGRWGIGGRAADNAAPTITFGIREATLTRPDGRQVAARLVAGLTDAVASVLGEQTRAGTSVELIATPEGRTATGGVISGWDALCGLQQCPSASTPTALGCAWDREAAGHANR